MRENMGLYRGKRTGDGEWVEGYLTYRYRHDQQARKEILGPVIDCPQEVTLGNTTGKVICSYQVDPETVGQFTGMTDIGGKRIFEGDIMETAVSGITHHTGAVLYQDGAFGLRCTDESASAFFLCFVAGYYTVIGNIHDTPVLTKEE